MVGEDGLNEVKWVLLGQLLVVLIVRVSCLLHVLGRALAHLLCNGQLSLVSNLGTLVAQVLTLLAHETACGRAV